MTGPERKYLDALRAHAADTRLYFTDRNKPERERAVCRAFLRCIGVSFDEHEIIAPAVEPADAFFRDARFQIRELPDKGRRRGDEWVAKQQRWNNACSMDGVVVPWKSPVAIALPDVFLAVADDLEAKVRHYGGPVQCAGIDALVYVNLLARYLKPTATSGDTSHLEAQGWRSVSVLFPPYGIVAATTADAPALLRAVTGRVLNAWSDPQDLFDPAGCVT